MIVTARPHSESHTMWLDNRKPANLALCRRLGMVSWLKCFGSGGNTVRDLLRKHNCTLTNGANQIAERGLEGNYGSIVFDGTDDYGAIPWTGTDFNRTHAFAFSVWVRFSSTSVDYRTIAIKRTTGGRHPGEIIVLPSIGAGGDENKIQVDSYNGSGGPTVVHSTLLNDDKWHFLVYNHHSNSTFDLYVDGELSGTSSAETGTTASGEDFRWGSDVALSREWGGLSDNFRIHSRDLSGREIRFMFRDDLRGNPQLLNWVHDRGVKLAGGRLLQLRRACA